MSEARRWRIRQEPGLLLREVDGPVVDGSVSVIEDDTDELKRALRTLEGGIDVPGELPLVEASKQTADRLRALLSKRDPVTQPLQRSEESDA